jgi:hypothetical protein
MNEIDSAFSWVSENLQPGYNRKSDKQKKIKARKY